MTLEKINSGTIEVEGELLTHIHKNGQLVTAPEKHIRQIRKKIGMVFQSFNLFPHMTVMKKRHRSADQSVGLIESGSGRTRRQFAAKWSG
ncbi:Amino acid ABC transporter [Klebsiella michiganensis]|uniref:Amino acid ABC transporter n=1 Tax=Klebsiella michiganensis TaxID=1134687 RepID=A0A7H4PRE4_9ENTR|nr:Amino acid ABC transporter [Klebsiella michiganensis]